jgi:hypothetical protein
MHGTAAVVLVPVRTSTLYSDLFFLWIIELKYLQYGFRFYSNSCIVL